MKEVFFPFQNTTSWIENGRSDYVKYNSWSELKIYSKRKGVRKTQKNTRSFTTFHVEINVLNIIKGRSSLFSEDFKRSDHETYKYRPKRVNSCLNRNCLTLLCDSDCSNKIRASFQANKSEWIMWNKLTFWFVCHSFFAIA